MKEKCCLHIVNQNIVKGELISAKKILEEAVKNSPHFFLYSELLGDIYHKKGKIKDAEIYYKRALELNPKALWIKNKCEMITSYTKKVQVKQNFPGIYNTYPDKSGKRKTEGGLRIKGVVKTSQIDKPLVSIVTVVYDNAVTFQRCIDSVKSNLYKHRIHCCRWRQS